MERHKELTYKEIRRIQGVEMYKKGFTQDDVAEAFGVDQGSVSRWVARESEGGEEALRTKSVTRTPCRLKDDQKEELKELLKRNPKEFGFEEELWTSPMIARLIKDQFGVSYHPAHVRRMLHKLNQSFQKPVKRATQRDEAAIEKWVVEDWPRIKKKV